VSARLALQALENHSLLTCCLSINFQAEIVKINYVIYAFFLGFIAFIAVAAYFLSRPSIEVQWQEKAVFSAFFAGAILCMGFSWIFHTVYCHSEKIGRLFNKYMQILAVQ